MSRTRLIPGAALAVLALALAGCAKEGTGTAAPPTSAGSSSTGAASTASSSPKVSGTSTAGASEKPGVTTVEGNLTVPSDGKGTEGAPCTTGPGYEDVKQGTTVKVSNPDKTVIAQGQLPLPTIEDGQCLFEFLIENVPSGFDSYGVEIGDRGILDYSADEIESDVIGMTLVE